MSQNWNNETDERPTIQQVVTKPLSQKHVTDDNSSDDRMVTNKSSMSSLKIEDSTTKLVTVETNAEVAIPITLSFVPITVFFPLISKIEYAFNQIVEIVRAAEHNKRTCLILSRLVHTAYLVALEFKIPTNNQQVFNKKNYLEIQILVNVVAPIKKFAAEISQMKTLIKYIKANSIMKTFNELFSKFNNYMNLLTFTGHKICIEDAIEQLKADQDDLNRVSLNSFAHYTLNLMTSFNLSHLMIIVSRRVES